MSGYSWFDTDNGGNGFWDTSSDASNWNAFGDMQVAITFEVTDDNYSLLGYKYWYDTAFPALVPAGFALWSCNANPATGVVVDGSVILSLPSPTVTGWQYAALETPLLLTAGHTYRVEFAASGGFFWASNYTLFETTGFTVGPINIFSDGGGSNPIPSTGGPAAQGSFSTATHVAGTVYPDTGYESGVPALDVLIDVAESGPLTFETTVLPNAELTTTYGTSIVAGGGTYPYTFAVTAGALPAGLSLASNGKFSGIPTTLGSLGFTVTVTDSVAATQSYDFSIKVTNLTFLAARDDFVRGDGFLGSDWTPFTFTGSSGLNIVSDHVKASGTIINNDGNWYNKVYYSPDQFSQITVVTPPSTSDGWVGPTVRTNASGDTCYVVIVYPTGGGLILYKYIAGTYTELGGYAATIATGDRVRIAVAGSTITVYYNGITAITETDTSIVSGQPGVSSSSLSGTFNDWTGGNGQGIVQVSYTSTSGHVDTYSVLSEINNTGNAGRQDMRVLRPDTPNPGYPHAFLWLLPVEPGQGTSFGDSIATVQGVAGQNNYNLTCIQPGFPIDPWYGDNVDDPKYSASAVHAETRHIRAHRPGDVGDREELPHRVLEVRLRRPDLVHAAPGCIFRCCFVGCRLRLAASHGLRS